MIHLRFKALRSSRPITLLAALGLGCATGSAQAQMVLFASNGGNNTVGAYNAVTGATINSSFIGAGQGLSQPWGMALDNNNHLFVVSAPNQTDNGWVGLYNATTGATINANFCTVPAGNSGYTFSVLALDGNNHIFVAKPFGAAKYDATTALSSTWNSSSLTKSYLAAWLWTATTTSFSRWRTTGTIPSANMTPRPARSSMPTSSLCRRAA